MPCRRPAAPSATGSHNRGMRATAEVRPPRPMTAALGLDAGGTGTRWALLAADGSLLGEGVGPPLGGGAALDSDAGRAALEQALKAITGRLSAAPEALVAGLTGYDGTPPAAAAALAASLTRAFGVAAANQAAMSDIELLCRVRFAPGTGIVVVAGTGSIAAHLDAEGTLQRAGGRGVLIDDAGGGHWIAREALQAVWRAEDASPGAWRRSPLAVRLFDAIGATDWAGTRRWVAAASRGQFGALALAVAEAAHDDPAALALLERAGRELARLPCALSARVGCQPLAWAGRVFGLHPAVARAFAAALPPGCEATPLVEPPHHGAARLARQRLWVGSLR